MTKLQSLLATRARLERDIEEYRGHLRNSDTTLANNGIAIADLLGNRALGNDKKLLEAEITRVLKVAELFGVDLNAKE